MSSNRTIAKNTIFLYFRMFLTMGVGLYTSRLILQALGVVDYGIYGLVGGIVTTFAFLNSAMASATQRYLSFDIGKNDTDRLQKTFNATLNIHILIAIVVFVLAETLGLWFVNEQLNIPDERMIAANWVYQFSIFAFVLEIVQVPYNALLFAREHMKVYAYVSIVETLLKLSIAILLLQFHTDRLILYAILAFVVAFIIRLIYKIYCKKHFKESVYHFFWDKAYYKELLSYSGWNLFGNIAAVARNQGSNILLNLFFGPVVNAAYTITSMLQGVIGSFVSNFQVAVNPQIVKNYAKGDTSSSLQLIYKSSKFSFFGMLLLMVPFLANTNYIMQLWLKQVPPYAVNFIRVALVYSLIETLANPLMAGAQATGKIKWYQIIIGSFIFLIFPTTYFVFKITNNPIDLYWVFIGNAVLALLFRILFLRRMIGMQFKEYFIKVILRICIVSGVVMLCIIVTPFSEATDFIQFIFHTVVLCVLSFFAILIFGTTQGERKLGIDFIKNKLAKRLLWKE